MGLELRNHSLAHELLASAMSKDELNDALETLSESAYHSNWRDSASCYVQEPPLTVSCKIVCSKCGAQSKLVYELNSYDVQTVNLEEAYKKIAAEYSALGYEAKVRCYCEKCVAEDPDHLAPITFSFYAEGMSRPVISYPSANYYFPRDYLLALSFLKGGRYSGTLKDLFEDKESSQIKYAKTIKTIIGPQPQHNKPEKDSRGQEYSRFFSPVDADELKKELAAELDFKDDYDESDEED